MSACILALDVCGMYTCSHTISINLLFIGNKFDY